MNLQLNRKLADRYTSPSQKTKILTESWVKDQVYCPNCGHLHVSRYANNKPVADFYCPHCDEDYELKSKRDTFGAKVLDGAYHTMIERLTGSHNPNLFLLNYDLVNYEVASLFVIPKHFFIPEIIEQRKPLATTARRARWVGCNIMLNNIPQAGKIFFIRNRRIEPKGKVFSEWKKTLFLREEKKVAAKGWLLDVMRCVEKLGRKEFSLEDVYIFEKELREVHPGNRHIKDKIRQQLQILRDREYLRFVDRGKYQLA